MSVDLRTKVGGVPLETCLYNASGPRSGTAAALGKVATSQSGAVLSKSATLSSQAGNPQPRTWHSPDGLASMNSEGLPNNGIDYYISGSTIEEAMGGSSKPYFVSLSGKTLDDNLEMFNRIAKAHARDKIKTIELNLACPNVIGKPIIAYDFDQMDAILTQISKLKGLPPIGVKLPPYLDFQHFKSAACVLNKHKNTVKYVASINTVGNAFALDVHSQAPVIASNAGFAGLSGPAVKYTALANVRKLRELLVEEIDVVGVGGICSGEDLFQMLLAGACACQVATTHWKEGPSCFERILGELKTIMVSEGFASVSEISKGGLKEWSKDGAALARRKAKETAATASGKSSGADSPSGDATKLYMYANFLFVVIIALLLADKYGATRDSLLPSE